MDVSSLQEGRCKDKFGPCMIFIDSLISDILYSDSELFPPEGLTLTGHHLGASTKPRQSPVSMT